MQGRALGINKQARLLGGGADVWSESASSRSFSDPFEGFSSGGGRSGPKVCRKGCSESVWNTEAKEVALKVIGNTTTTLRMRSGGLQHNAPTL